MGKVAPVTGWDPDNPLGAVGKETAVSRKALMDYATMGTSRSLRKLQAIYQAMAADWSNFAKSPTAWRRDHKGKPDPKEPPTVAWDTLTSWSANWAWQDRVKKFDEIQRNIERLEFESDRVAWKRERIASLKVAHSKLVQSMAGANTKMDLDRITNALVKLQDAMRLEFGEGTGELRAARGVRMVVVKLPAGADGAVLVPNDDLEENED